MKRIILLFLALAFLNGCSIQNEIAENKSIVETDNNYVKSVWITYYELESFTKNSNEEDFKNKIDKAFKELKEIGFNTVTVQVRPCADAFYVSKYFPSSKYCFGKQGAEMTFDPLKIICSIADNYNIKVEAWINPFRVSQDNKTKLLSENNKAKIWLNSKSKKSNVYVNNEGIYFNPASSEVRKLIVNGVKEIVKNYNISAIHFDDYFYPTTKKDIDKQEYKKYKEKEGNLSLSEWRQENINKLVRSVYKAVKSIKPEVKFGISPAADIENNKNNLYADAEKWVSEEGYVDYICPQVYFGFRNVYKPFMFTVKKWMYITKCDMFVGLPLYKAGKPDKYAAEENKNIINEFKNNNNIIARQVTYISKLDEIKGFYIFSYSCLFDEAAKDETENLIKALQSINR